MGPKQADRIERALQATHEEVGLLIHDADPEVLLALLQNPAMNEDNLVLLLQRHDLPDDVLIAVARRRNWMRSYRVKLRVASHPHSPRLTVLPLLKQLFLFDLVNLSIQPATPAEVRRAAEESIIARLPQLPLGQKLTLARRGSGRVASALLTEGLNLVIPLALDNPSLTEGLVLKILAREDLPQAVVDSVSRHRRWSCMYNVRMALVRHPLTALARVLAFLPDLTLGDLEVLSGASTLSPELRGYICAEVAHRRRTNRRPAHRKG